MGFSRGNPIAKTASMRMTSALNRNISFYFRKELIAPYEFWRLKQLTALVNCLLVGAGGMIGSVGRYLFGLLPIKMYHSFPIHTLLINIIGAFMIGLIVALAEKNSNTSPQLLLFLKVGVCGGFTTFSTFSWEAMDLLQGGKFTVALVYMVLSVVLCVSAVAITSIIIK